MEDKDNCEILPDDYPKYDYSYKVIVIGNSGVGKSCLSLKATKNQFENNYLATIGFEFFTFNVKIKDKIIKLQIWDTCGQEIYRSLVTNFYRNSSLAVIVYAIDDMKSFEDIDSWLKDLKTHSSPDIKIFLIGNKVDLEDKRVVTMETAKQFKDEVNIDMLFETSAKTGFNAKNLFVAAGKLLYEEACKYPKRLETKLSLASDLLNTVKKNSDSIPTPTKKKSKCC